MLSSAMVGKPHHPGIAIRLEIAARGWSVAAAAKELGTSRQALHNIVSGKSGISAEMAIRLERVFRIPRDRSLAAQAEYEVAENDSLNLGGPTISSSTVQRWGKRLGSRSLLPELIRRLVLASVADLKSVTFPSGEDSQRPGWDGEVQCGKGNAWVPTGNSGWELSTEGKPQHKADQDYASRRKEASRQRIFIFVTTERWDARKWAQDKRAEKLWREVRVYDASNIVEWLGATPRVAIWFAEQAGIAHPGVETLVAFWQRFSTSTAPAVTSKLLLAGRDESAQKLKIQDAERSEKIEVLSLSNDEAIAFYWAATKSSSALVVSSPDAVRHLLSSDGHGEVLCWNFSDSSLQATALDRGYRLLIPRDLRENLRDAIQLPQPDRASFTHALVELLTNEEDRGKQPRERQIREQAERWAKACGWSLTSFRRRFARGSAERPKWAQDDDGSRFSRLMLAGGWSLNSPGDRARIAELTQMSAEEAERLVKRYPDGPFRRVGGGYRLASPLEAWSLLAGHLNQADLERFERTVLEILPEPDPSEGVDPIENVASELVGRARRRQHSQTFREGLLDSLIMLGCVVDQFRLDVDIKGLSRAAGIVRALLETKAVNPWLALADVLDGLAEAAPDPFLDSLESSLKTHPSAILALFEERPGLLGSSPRHTHLLWALEQLAWEPDYFARSFRLLGRLVEKDPGGSYANRPLNSLRQILLPECPNTAASLEARNNEIERMAKNCPSAAWKLLLSLQPAAQVGWHSPSKPRWRTLPDRETVTREGGWAAYQKVIQLSLGWNLKGFHELFDLVEKLILIPGGPVSDSAE